MNKLNKTQQVILNLLANSLFHANRPVMLDVDWNEVYRESRQQTVSILTYSSLPEKIKENELVQKWREQVMYMLSNNVYFNYEHIDLNQIMESANIPYVILKGSVSASYYPNPLMRIMGDVDFLINKNDIKKVDLLLKQNGFVFVPSNHECEMAYHRQKSIWELHWEVNGIPDGKIGDKIHEFMSNIIESAVIASTDSGCYFQPSQFHHGLIMLLHIARHMITGGIGLRHLCDWAVFVEAIQDNFLELFESKLKEIGMWRFAQLLTQLSVVYLGSTPQPWMGEIDKDLLNKLMHDIFEGGNFGHKKLQRSDEAKFITNRKKGTVNNDSVFKQSILSANEIVRRHWNFVDKVPFLLPFGWIFFGSRYLFRFCIGKRPKIEVNKLIDGANDRKEIYRQFHLFEQQDK